MRLVLFHPSFETVGGAELLAAEQAIQLKAEGCEVHLATLAFDAHSWGERLGDLPVDVIPKRHWTDLFRAWSRTAKLKVRGKRAERFLRNSDVVLAYNHPCNAMLGVADIPGRKVWQCNEPPRGLHLREANPNLYKRVTGTEGTHLGLDFASQKFSTGLSKYEASMASKWNGHGLSARREFDLAATRNLDTIFAISEFSRDNARNIYGRCNEEVVYPIVRFPDRPRSRRGIDRAGLNVLVHSRIEVFKNIDTVMRAFRQFKEHTCPGARLHIVGEGPEKQRLRALAQDLLPEGGIRFYGYLPTKDLQDVYEMCDVFALLPLDEPFGMVFPEAASRGLSLIGPDHGGPMEIMDGGKLGLAVDAFSPGAVTEALERIWRSSDDEIERQREAADKACRSRFSAEAIMPVLMKALS